MNDSPIMRFGKKSTSKLPPLVQMTVEEASALGYDGPISYAEGTRTLTVERLGEVALGPFIDRSEGLTEPQQRANMRSAIKKAVRALPRAVAPEHEGLPPALQEAILRQLTRLSTTSGDPGPIQAIARIERAAGVEGWEQRMLSAIEIYRGRAADRVDGPDSHLGAASLLRLLGRVDEATAEAEAAMPYIHTAWSEQSYNPGAALLCNALVLAERRSELRATAEKFGQPQIGPRWWPVCTAAGAAEAGDLETLAREVDAVRRLADAEPLDWVGTHLSDRDLSEILEQWLNELS